MTSAIHRYTAPKNMTSAKDVCELVTFTFADEIQS